MKRWEENMAVALSWLVDEKLPVSAMRISEYNLDLHMNTRSFLSLSILFSSASPSSLLSLVSKRNSNAAPKPLPVYRYSSSLEKRVGLMEVGRRRMVPGVFVDGEGEPAR